MYITYQEYTEYGGTGGEELFNRYEFDAERELDRLTFTVDSVRKLEVAFPSGKDAEAVKRCMVAVIDRLSVLDDIGTDDGGNGAFSGRPLASMSSGSESVSFMATSLDKARSSEADRSAYLRSTIRRYLEGVQDANGVNLLYGGPYPCIVTQ